MGEREREHVGPKVRGPEDDELMTVQTFAEKFMVDVSIVRGWCKRKLIPYELVGPRKLRRLRPSDILKPIQPEDRVLAMDNRDKLTRYLAEREGMDMETIRLMIDSMDADSVRATLALYEEA